MQRILEPGQIEALAQRSIPRLRRPDRSQVFVARADRLRSLATPNHAIGDYLRLMASLVEAQHAALADCQCPLPTEADIARARTHGMPVAPATQWARDERWLRVLQRLCEDVAATPGVPPAVRETCERLCRAPHASLEAQADALLTGRAADVDAAGAPFVAAALQVLGLDLASRLADDDVAELGTHDVCPVCGSLPVASIVRSDSHTQGYRYLHCASCATEWHRVRVTCTQCASTKGITYQAIEGGPEAVRAECCESCRTYRKILYQEKDPQVDPVADDLASLALDLLLGDAGFRRASGNPLLWQPRG